ATPLAAVALLKGVSPGAVLIGLLLGPAMNLGTIEVLRRAYKPRAVAAAVLAIVAAAFAVGFAANAVALPVTVPAELFGVTSGRWLGVLAASALGLALVSQVWRWGLRPWLEILDPGHKHGHDHDHDHDKCRAHEHEH
ncbi:MAG: hypothetical protein JKY37_10175, partial [Nannocystaceae bacterium]|nr:hypothetical protein [Nannocystaceae bacterium]